MPPRVETALAVVHFARHREVVLPGRPHRL